MKNAFPVLVTGVGGGGNGEQLIKALRLGETFYAVVAADITPLSKGLAEADIPCLLPSASDPGYVSAVLNLCKVHGIRAVLAGSEPELRILSKNRELLHAADIFFPANPEHVIKLCSDKAKTMSWLKENGFSCPETRIIKSSNDIDSVDFLPAVLKPSRGSGGSVNIFLAMNKKELFFYASFLLDRYDEFVIQAYVGRTDAEYTVGVLSDMDGVWINAIAVKKTILSGLNCRIKEPNTTGNSAFGDFLAISNGISQGEIGRFPEVTEECSRLAAKLGSKCAINIQCRLVDGRPCIFEINPRFSGTTSLRSMVGYNEPDILIRKHVLGEVVNPGFSFKRGHILRGLTEVFAPDLAVIEDYRRTPF